MRSSILLNTLGKLSPAEFKQFRSHINNQHSGKKVIIRVLNYIKDYHPLFDSDELNKQYAYARIFKKEKYVEKKLENALSDLNLRLKAYLIDKYLEEYDFEREFLSLQVYKKYQLDKPYFSLCDSLNKDLKKIERIDSWHWLKEMALSQEHYFHPSTIRVTKETKIQEAMNQLDLFYAASKLRIACELYNRKQVLQAQLPPILLLEELSQIPETQNHCYFIAYQLALKLIKSKEASTYFELKNYLQENALRLNNRDNLTLFSYLLNFVAGCLKNSLHEFNDEALSLFKLGIDQKILIVDGYFDVAWFNNIVDFACKLKKIEWAKNFVKTWQETIPENAREDTVILSEAFICFAEGDFSKTLELLSSSNFTNIYCILRSRILTICCLYELQEHVTVDIQCKSFEQFIRRKDIVNVGTQKAVLGFISIVKKLISVNPKKEAVAERLKKQQNLYFGVWLKEKISQL